MKNLFSVFLLFSLKTTLLSAGASDIRIAKFHDDKAAAISYTFDDGLRDQFEIAAPMLDAHGIHATFFIITKPVAKTPEEGRACPPGKFGGISWPELKDLSERGHEIANHTWTHRDFRRIPWQEVRPELDLADQDIRTHLGFAPLTVAYTANSFFDEARKEALRYHLADRTFQTAFGGPKFTEADADKWLDETLRDRKWSVAMIHGIVQGFYPFTDPQILAHHLDYAVKFRDRLWIDTFVAVANYVRTRDASRLTVTSAKKGEATFILTADLPPSSAGVVFPHADLTVVIPVPGAHEATALRDGKPLQARVTDDRILVSAKPDPEPVTVRWK
jgi:peptidoglycan/xylan/chitin deacetylase (PgdA/CDA1 family)